MLVVPKIPDPEIGFRCDGALGSDFGLGGNAFINSSGLHKLLSCRGCEGKQKVTSWVQAKGKEKVLIPKGRDNKDKM